MSRSCRSCVASNTRQGTADATTQSAEIDQARRRSRSRRTSSAANPSAYRTARNAIASRLVASAARGGGPPRKIASIGIHIAKWVTTHGYALNVDLDPAPFTKWITACGLEDAAFTTMARELGRPLSVDDVHGAAAAAIAEVFDLEVEAHQVPAWPVEAGALQRAAPA